VRGKGQSQVLRSGKASRRQEGQSGRAETKTDGKEDGNDQPRAEQERKITTEMQSKA